MVTELFKISNYYLNFFALPVLVVSIFMVLAGIFVLRQNRKSIVNVAFCYECFSIGLWLFAISLVYFSANAVTAFIWYRYFTFFGVVNIMPSLMFFGIAWLGWQKRMRFFLILNYLVAFSFYVFAIISDKLILPYAMTNYFWGFYPVYKPWALLFMVHFFIQAVIGYGTLYFAYRTERVLTKKRQIGLIAVANLIGFTAVLDFLPKFINISLYPYGYISLFIFISLVGYSIVRYRAFDIETVLPKTILWMLSYSFIAVPILFLYNGLGDLIERSQLLLFAFWTVAFLVVTVYLRLVQPQVDHFFQRRKANLEEISTEFSKDLVHLRGLEQLIKHIEQTIAEALYSQNVDIAIYNQDDKTYKGQPFLVWLAKNDKIAHRDFIEIDPAYASIREAARGYFNSVEAVVVIPLVLNERLLGVINLAKKSNLKRYTALDFNFLSLLKNQSAIAISNSLVYGNIEEQVKKRTAELIKVQNQLTQAAKLATVGTLAGGVAHEINNPLAAILTNAQMMLASLDEMDIDETRESVELIEEATKRCRAIVKKLMTYARKPLDSAEIVKTDLLEVVKKVDAFLNYQLKQENIQINIEAKTTDYFVMGNQNELEQVVTNIVLNAKDAIKRVKKNGTIDISLVKNPDWVRLNIKDEGLGIPRDQVPKIFDPFFTTKDVGKGLGLGLSISQSIVEKYQGSIFLQSEEGQGTTFTVNLPYAG